jgi:hypothetical protein
VCKVCYEYVFTYYIPTIDYILYSGAMVMTSQISTDSYISFPEKGYITHFVPESTCFYVAASRQTKNKSYICNPFLAGWGSPLLEGG